MSKNLLVTLCLCATSCAAVADTLTLAQNSFSNGVGGQFTATPVTGFAGITGQAADLGAGSFETFCLERNENFNPGGTFSYTINTFASQGGVGGQDPVGSGQDPLDARTAYLYFNFRMGTLTGFDYGAGRLASAGALQDAIWFIENEGGANNAFVALADAAVNSGAWTGLGPVRVLNLSSANHPYAQDQLTIIPAPGAAGALALVSVAALRRRRA
jgi:hypothetical protein